MTVRRANGRKLNILYALIASIVLYVVWVLLTPEMIAYQAGGVLKVTCTTAMRETFYRSKKTTWEKSWVRRAHSLGIRKMDPEQYEFTISEPCTMKTCSCEAETVFQLITPWIWLDQIIDIEPRTTTHRKSTSVDYRAEY
jgi:hypothetical protein